MMSTNTPPVGELWRHMHQFARFLFTTATHSHTALELITTEPSVGCYRPSVCLFDDALVLCIYLTFPQPSCEMFAFSRI